MMRVCCTCMLLLSAKCFEKYKERKHALVHFNYETYKECRGTVFPKSG